MTKVLVLSSLLAKSMVASYTRSDGVTVQAHDNGKQAAAPKPDAGRRVAKKPASGGYVAPKEGEVGHHEHTQYGAYFRKGDKVKDGSGKTHEVAEHRGASVRTTGGEMFHPTKLSFVSSASKDGAGDASSDKQAAPDNGKPVKRVVKQLKAYHKADAKSLKSSLGSALSSGDTEGDDGKPLTYGNVNRHLQTMRSQLGKDAVSAQHLEHAQYAVNQSMGADHAPLSEKHAKLIGAALSGRTRIDDNGAVRHA